MRPPLPPPPPLSSPPLRDDNTAPFDQICHLKKNGYRPTDGRTKPLIEMRGRI